MMKPFLVRIRRCASAVALMSLSTSTLRAIPIDQTASSVIAFSSQWSSFSWAAFQVLGPPNTFSYGDIATAWAPAPMNGTIEFITVGYATPVYADGATIRETYGNGFVIKIEARDLLGMFHPVWAGVDLSLPGSPVDFLASFGPTPFLVDALRITTDTDHNPGAWEEIDSIILHGDTEAPVGVPDAGRTGTLLALMGLVLMMIGRGSFGAKVSTQTN